MKAKTGIKKLIESKSGIRLDIGCGENKNPGFVGIDMLPLKGVDIVWDLEEFPWPLPDESVLTATASHVLEHINPHKGVFINFMNEVWRVLKKDGQFAFVVPHASSHGYQQDPTHVNMINETTMHYFDPDPEGNNIGAQLYNFYKPKPWKIEKQYFSPQGNLEVLLTKRLEDPQRGLRVPQQLTDDKR
jgi:SAM-dependent methyltransferase